jgi:hypothetical protein
MKANEELKEMMIAQAKFTLKQAGYFVDNLWHVDDVRCKFKDLTDEDCQNLLNKTLTNEWIMEQIWESMCEIGDAYNFKMIND